MNSGDAGVAAELDGLLFEHDSYVEDVAAVDLVLVRCC